MKVAVKKVTPERKKKLLAIGWMIFLAFWIGGSLTYEEIYLSQILPAAGIITFLLAIRDYSI